jgi:hypothetical protein
LLWLVPFWIKLCAALQTELQGQDPTYWLWCRCRNSRSIMLLLQVFYLLSNFTCRCQYQHLLQS